VNEGEEADTRQRKFLFLATVDSQIAPRDFEDDPGDRFHEPLGR
jgi:hypothetical protein